MSRLMFVVTTLLCVAVFAVVPAATAGEASRSGGSMPQMVGFDHEHFLGDHTHVFGTMKELGKWDNSISSIVILSGTWEFFDDEDFKGTKMATLGPGVYPKVTAQGLKDNSISLIRLVNPTTTSARYHTATAGGAAVGRTPCIPPPARLTEAIAGPQHKSFGANSLLPVSSMPCVG